jgi:hypothetical protein
MSASIRAASCSFIDSAIVKRGEEIGYCLRSMVEIPRPTCQMVLAFEPRSSQSTIALRNGQTCSTSGKENDRTKKSNSSVISRDMLRSVCFV